ncbi:MAG TPA: polysaccharide biosynthesis protein [Lachnospiraceae bacterium]|nr:polysaccharide biosynthesis protein [Lachnospiraceae bacterium]
MKKNESRSSNFIVQGGILAIAGIISRIIGLLYRVPLQRTIGDRGMGYYSAAFQIYSIMLIISSYSLPVAVSKLMAARLARGQYRNARKLFHGALLFAVITGGAAMLIVLLGADVMADNILSMPRCAIALRILAPTLLVVALMGVMRGYFQGTGTMLPTATSQLLEQIVNAVVSVAAAIFLYDYGLKVAALLRDDACAPAYGAAGGTLGTLAGAAAGLIMLAGIFLFNRKELLIRVEEDRSVKRDSLRKVFRLLVITVMPVILSSTIYNISDVLDQSIFGKVMAQRGMGEAAIASNWGVFTTKYKTIINVPVALANALCSSMMPSLTASVAQGDLRVARRKIRISMRFVMIIAIPCAVGLAVLGEPVLSIMFTGEIRTAAILLRIGSASVIFYSMSTLSNGVLQGVDRMNIPVRNSAIALVAHLGVLYLTTAVFDLKLYGVVISIVFFSLLVSVLNWIDIRRNTGYRQEIFRTFVVPLIASLIMGLIIGIMYFLLSRSMRMEIATLISIAAGVVIYFVALLLLKGVRESEIRSFPGGNVMAVIAKFLHLI